MTIQRWDINTGEHEGWELEDKNGDYILYPDFEAFLKILTSDEVLKVAYQAMRDYKHEEEFDPSRATSGAYYHLLKHVIQAAIDHALTRK